MPTASSATTSVVKKTTDEMNVKPYLDYEVGLIRFIRDFERIENKVILCKYETK